MLCYMLLCFVGAWFYLHWATPIYNISATVLIKDEKKGGGAGLSSELEDMGLSGLMTSSKNIDNELEVLRSKTLVKEVVNQLGLYITYKDEDEFPAKGLYLSLIHIYPIGRTFKSSYKIDFTKCTYYSWNIVSAAIQFAIYLGYKEIRLLGCDYSLFASRFITHMYDKDGLKIPCPYKLRDMLYKYTFTTHIHYELAKYAEKIGVKIINMTGETLLDAYEIDENSKY